MSSNLTHQVLKELSSGDFYGIFIDDTGSPGNMSELPPLDPERKTWVGVVVEPEIMPEVVAQFPEALDELRKVTDANEFHFTDILSGNKEFAGVPLETRLALIKFMAGIFEQYRFPVFVQTFDPSSLGNVLSRGNFQKKVGPFNLEKPSDAALLFLLIQLKTYVEENRKGPTTLAHVLIDEGFKKAGAAIPVKAYSHVFADSNVKFANSSIIHPIQLADFAAYVVNRQKMLLDREALKLMDKAFLRIVSEVSLNFQNIPRIRVNPSDWPKTKMEIIREYQKAEDAVGIKRTPRKLVKGTSKSGIAQNDSADTPKS